MAVQTSAGTVLSVSAGVPATYDSGGFGALSWTTVGEITDLGEYGRVYNLVTHNPIGSRATNKFKGSYNDGSIALQMAEDTSDAGQTILDAALTSDNEYAFRIVAQDGDIDYFQARVMSKTVSIGSVDSIRSSTVQIELTNSIVDA